MPAPAQLKLRKLRSGDALNSLSLGDEAFLPLKNFLKNNSVNFHESNIAKTYVLVPVTGSKRVWAYISLTCSQVTLEDAYSMEDCQSACLYENLPAIKIVRLAVDKRIKGIGYGSQLVELAISIALDEVMPKVGCRFLITDAKSESVVFYEKTGFTLLNTEQNKSAEHPLMFIDLHKLKTQ